MSAAFANTVSELVEDLPLAAPMNTLFGTASRNLEIPWIENR